MQDRPIRNGIWALSIARYINAFKVPMQAHVPGRRRAGPGRRLSSYFRRSHAVRTPFAVHTPFAIRRPAVKAINHINRANDEERCQSPTHFVVTSTLVMRQHAFSIPCCPYSFETLALPSAWACIFSPSMLSMSTEAVVLA